MQKNASAIMQHIC